MYYVRINKTLKGKKEEKNSHKERTCRIYYKQRSGLHISLCEIREHKQHLKIF